jgi:hypothetical protein
VLQEWMGHDSSFPLSSCTDIGLSADRQPGDLSSSRGSDLALEMACPMTTAGNQIRDLDPPHAPPSQP